MSSTKLLGRYTFSKRPKTSARLKSLTLQEEEVLYAELALDVNIKDISDRLFTYEIPTHLKNEIFVGSQVLVPFGKQELVSAFVVSIRDRNQILASASRRSDNATSELPEKIKPISEVLDSNPLFDPKYIEFLYWISEYYLCSISDVLLAAIPAEIGARVKRMVRLIETEEPNRIELLQQFHQSPTQTSTDERLKNVLKEAGKSISIRTLKDRSGLTPQNFYGALTRLKRRGEVEIYGQQEESAAPRLINHVIWTGMEPSSKRQQEILNYVKQNNGTVALQRLIEETRSSAGTIKRMVSDGVFSITQVDTVRDPLKGLNSKPNEKPALTANQSSVLDVLTKELEKSLAAQLNEPGKSKPEESDTDEQADSRPWLLHGVTGSGKTEVYLRLIETTLEKGRTALLMVPEISLTPQLAQRLVGRFGDQVAIWHSALSAGERYDTFRRIQSGELRVVLGARSAILANIPDLGLIILDEEHDGSYKQSTPNPRYSAKHLAIERAKRDRCLVLLGSATPDAVTYLEAKEANRIVSLPTRVHDQALPESVIVDMRREFITGNKSIISTRLQQEIADCLGREEQVILLMNRRGYASHVFCRACGKVINCKHCSVSLVYHNEKNFAESNLNKGGRFSCHHCGFQQSASEVCPSCQSPFLKQSGMGTQKVEQETLHLFPKARILRLDSDVSSKKGAYQEIFDKFSQGEADILIGTQMVAKGLDIARVTLVGVLAADAAFNLPDFRSLERGFQLLTQVSGRAGRGKFPGRVILQTHNTDLPALALAKEQDYQSFIDQELASRRDFEYPPYSQLIRILASGTNSEQVESALEQIAEEMSNYLEEFEEVKILGPAACLIERIKGMYRQHIIIKNMMGERGNLAIASYLRKRLSPPGVRITVDVDPVDLI